MKLSPTHVSLTDMNRIDSFDELAGTAPARFSADEFLRMAELGAFDDMKLELDHGELVRMNPPNLPHGIGQAQISGALFQALKAADALAVGEVSIVLGRDTVRVFDAAVITKDALGEKILKPEHVLLAVEVADTTLEQDLGRKLRDYATAKIPVYWVVDVNARVVHVMTQPSNGDYRREVLRFGERLIVPGTDTAIVLD
jgi:Uma2 family endonuclease